MSAGADLLDEDHEEHENHEAWVIPYADMLTLLMALFLMLFAISSVDLKKFEQLADSLSTEFGGGGSSEVLDGGESFFDGGTSLLAGFGVSSILSDLRPELAEQALQREEAAAEAALLEARDLDLIEQQVTASAAEAGILDSIGFRREARGLVVTIVADHVMFDPGQANVRSEGSAILGEIAAALRALPNHVVIEGHTDNVPIRGGGTYRSNWELSTARATEVLRHLVEGLGLPPRRVSAAGYGDQRPIASNDTVEGRTRNRRVEIAILSESPLVS